MSWRRPLSGVAAAAIVTHLTALGAGFVWLDHAHIEDRLAIAPPAGWPSLFARGFAGTGYYRPLTALSLSIDAVVGSPLVYHATSIAWHAAAAVLVVLAADALGLARRAAVLAGLFFAVHPLSALVADAIAFRSEAMVAAALLTLVWAHSRGRPLLAAAAIASGALTKEIAFPLAPLFVIAVELSRKSRPAGRARLFAAEGAALGGAFALRVASAPAWRASHPPLSVGDALGTRLASLAKSVAAVVLPIDRTICDAFPVTHVHQPAALAGAVAFAALAWGAWKRRGPALLLAFAVLPSLQLVPVTRWWSPHYVYVPLAFLAMLVGELVERQGYRLRAPSIAVLLALAGVTLHDGRKYASDATLWAPEVEAHPACREAQFYLGEVARGDKQWDAAAKRYEAALAPKAGVLSFVDRRAALQNLGIVRVEQHRLADARSAFRAALEGTIDPAARRELTHDLAAATLSDGDAAEAARLLEAETARPDALPQSILVRAMALEELGRVEEARALRSRLGR